MIGLDTNVLARYYIDDSEDAEATRQRLAARRLIDSGQALMVSKTVVLELEWVMRGYYGFSQGQIATAMNHLLQQSHITIEDRESVATAVASSVAGIDFADALNHASYRGCDRMVTFDDRRFARRAKRLAMAPTVTILS